LNIYYYIKYKYEYAITKLYHLLRMGVHLTLLTMKVYARQHV
jgi:hypothetical protein